MTRADAIRKVMKLLGPKAYWRIGGSITSPERREAAKRKRLQHQFSVAMLNRDMNERSRALLESDEMYQSLKVQWQAQTKALDHVPDEGYRFEVGTQSGGPLNFLTSRAYGDTWEEVFAKLETKETKAS